MCNTCCNFCGGTTRQNNGCNSSTVWIVTPVNACGRTGGGCETANASTSCSGGLFNILFPWSGCGWSRCNCCGYGYNHCGCSWQRYNGCARGCLYGNNTVNQTSACFGRCNRTYTGNGCGSSVNVLNANSTTDTTDDYYVRQYKLNGTATTSTSGCGCGCGCQF